MAGRYIPSKRDGTVKSPLAGLVKCANCGMNMQRMVMKRYPYLLCTRPGCCASTKFELVEKRVLDSSRIRWISFPCASPPPVCRIPPPELSLAGRPEGAGRRQPPEKPSL